ncbi:MAG: hypothetical protein KKC14_17730 [Alphaproteobacteria bacterium]|nr:hypothetical protein [Alphaproteobacteria bacterium]
MMKYEPLLRFLQARSDSSSIRLTFAEINEILGFQLPRSARDHQAWWSNTRLGHSHAAAWLDAGWKTEMLDLDGERVTFVKSQQGVSEEGAAFRRGPANAETVVLNLADLSPAAHKLIHDHARDHGVDTASAVIAILDEIASKRLRAMLDGFAKAFPPSTVDSVDLIREDRDAR